VSAALIAIDSLRERGPLDAAAVDRFLAGREVPIVEGARCTFLYRGEADEVFLVHRIFRLPDHLPLRRLPGTDLWYLVMALPAGARVEYQLEVARGGQRERINDPLNPHVARSPVGDSSVCYASGYSRPPWTVFDPAAPAGSLAELMVRSRALRRDCRVTLYLPASFDRSAAYPLLIVHDGGDYLGYADAKTVLDNLIARRDVPGLVAAFTYPGERLTEYADSLAHARYLTAELLPRLAGRFPLAGRPGLMGCSFGAVASLATAYRYPRVYGSLLLQSGSFVFSGSPGSDGVAGAGRPGGGGGPDAVWAPVARFVDRYRAAPRRVADRVFVSCGSLEPLVVPNRAMIPVLEGTGMAVRYVEAPDGHSWGDWRDRLRDGLSWIFPTEGGL
jgi:enterochelin esterase-like enzyme